MKCAVSLHFDFHRPLISSFFFVKLFCFCKQPSYKAPFCPQNHGRFLSITIQRTSESPIHPQSEYPIHLVSESPIHSMSESPIHSMSEYPIHLVSECPIHSMSESPIHLVSESPIHLVSESPIHLVSEWLKWQHYHHFCDYSTFNGMQSSHFPFYFADFPCTFHPVILSEEMLI